MVNKTLKIDYLEYESFQQLPEIERVLLEKAIKAAEKAYAPYSGFHVGAAVLLENGEIFPASNQENAAYPSGLCAERTAVFYAGAQFPGKRMEAIAIAALVDGKLTEDITYPCGACRQVLAEYEANGGKDMKVILGSSRKVEVFKNIKSLMPFAFDNLNKDVGK